MANVSSQNFKEFEKAYKAAVMDEKASFRFEGVEVLVMYAQYVCEAFHQQEARNK